MKKTRLLSALQGFIFRAVAVCIAFFCLAPTALATSPITDDFESYTTGWISTQSPVNWHITPDFQIIDSGCYSGKCASPTNSGMYSDNGTPLTEGELYFWYYSAPDNSPVFYFTQNDTPVAYFMNFVNTGGFADVRNGNTHFEDLNFPVETWTHLGIRWLNQQIALSTDGGGTWTSYFTPYGGFPAVGIDGIYAEATANARFDNFDAGLSPVIEGYYPILTTATPTDNLENIVDFDNFLVSGNLSIPTANTSNYDTLKVKFSKNNSFFPTKVLTFPLGGITGGSSVDYSATTSIPITQSGGNFFKVSYSVSGTKYYGSYADNPLIDNELLPYNNTWVKDSATPVPLPFINPSIKPAQDALQDCSGFSGIEKVICDLKNFVVGAVLPSDEALTQIGGTLQALKTRAPVNYIGSISETLTNIYAGINESSGFSFSILGNAGVVDTSIFSIDLGSGITIGGTIKIFLTFLLFIIFLAWGLNYMHRIL